MKKRLFTVGSALPMTAMISLLAVSANADLIVNGSFENHPAFQFGTWGLYNSIPGWSVASPPSMEIGLGGIYGVTGYDGQAVMELDSTGNVKVDQIVATAGGSYTLSFLYAQRSGVSPTSGSFDVYWNGGLLTSFAPTSTAMALYSTTVNGLAVNTLEFRGTGTSNGLGAILDDVSMTAVPEPSTVIAGALLMLPFGASTLRMLRKKHTA